MVLLLRRLSTFCLRSALQRSALQRSATAAPSAAGRRSATAAPSAAGRRCRGLLLVGFTLLIVIADAQLGCPVAASTRPVAAAAGAGSAAEVGMPSAQEAPERWEWPLFPVPEVLRAFDAPVQNWLPGHRGVDLSADPGQVVLAPAAGIVSFAGTVVDRPVVTLSVDGGTKISFEPVAARVKAGKRVEAGQVIGTIDAAESHCVGCLHWGVRKEGRYLDPMSFVMNTDSSILLPRQREPKPDPKPESGSGPMAWGGHRNGQIPKSALCPISHAPHQFLRCDAARSVAAMNAAFRSRFGVDLVITDAYRDLATQRLLKRTKPHLSATPGKSNHGWGLAIDFGGGINRFGSAQHVWMREHAGKYGWSHPAWARAGGSKPEAWHWEFRN
ncbi:peptidoglycan DD-metalloendopeptidase family protein [Saxibacter everestensis]|uniref:Peptidoglycan DD-metalloendopeptidase family protein n=1 Tax=Saxibacter everestensis TaxID=2909229 RepID=A0ABY8QW95_9MICO|nr:peptidoglycan DD-metalloendopeptidase family protein [Brevibacteriaceae bacterium ZFBP1038]